MEQQKTETTTLEHNLRFFNMGCEVPSDALKTINAGRLRGMSDVNPMWRMKRMTELFGPVGFGWRYEIDRQWTETYGEEVKCFCNVLLYVRDPETKEWSQAIPGNGGSAVVSKEKNGVYVNDEGYKMALTDALSIAMKPLGIGANIWYGPKATGHNESKYEQDTRQKPQQAQTTKQPQQTQAFTGAQLKQALGELAAVGTRSDFDTLWRKWASRVPAMCQSNGEFHKAAAKKVQELQ